MTNLNEKCNNLNMKKLTLKLWKKMSLSGSSIEPHVDHGWRSYCCDGLWCNRTWI